MLFCRILRQEDEMTIRSMARIVNRLDDTSTGIAMLYEFDFLLVADQLVREYIS